MIPIDEPAPTSVEGALLLQVGEARGASSGSELGVEGSVAIGAVGGINAGATTSSQAGTTVERVGDSTFLVTIDSSDTDGTNYGLSLSQASIGNSESDTSSKKMTVKFDLSTAQGKKAFEEFNRTHTPPKAGGQVISQTDAEKHREGTTIKIGSLGSASINSTTSESVTYDESGKTEVYEGEFGWEVDEIDLPFIGGDGDIKAASRIVETEVNDEKRAHMLSLFVDCEDGDDSRAQLAKLTGMGDYDEGKEKASGKWSVSARISDDQLQTFVERFEDHEERDEDIFGGGSDARNQLTKKLHRAKDMDDKMRAVAWFVAHDDLDRQNLGDMRQVLFGEDWGGADRNFDYDVLLKDDKGKVDRNFRGASGRAELDGKVEKFQSLMKASGASGQATLFDSLDGEVKELQRRKSEVADPTRYSDLPSELRRQQIMQIDAYLATFIGMRRQAGMEASKLRPGQDFDSEEDGKLLAADQADGDMDPAFRDLRKLRSDIARTDFRIDSAKGFYEDGSKELLRTVRDPEYYPSHRLTTSRSNQTVSDARTISENAAALMPAVEEIRASFLRVSANPQAALPVANMLLAQLHSVQSMYESAEQMIANATAAAETAGEERTDGIIVSGEWYASWADVKAGKKGVTDMEQMKAPEEGEEEEGELIDVGGRKVRVIDDYDEGTSMKLPE
jgi:hypothetical protein